MNARDTPVLIAYDGSDPARRAVRDAAELFGSRPALLVTVWEPGLAYATTGTLSGSPDMAPLPVVDFDTAREIDRGMHEHAERVAQDGAELARSLGLDAEPLAVPDEGHVADAILGVARERGVAAIVVGSRGLSGLRARLEGSTSNAILKHAPCPVVVVHEPSEQDA